MKAFFKSRVAEARKVVPEPELPQPKLKLKVTAPEPTPTPKIMFRMGTKESSTESPAQTPRQAPGTPADTASNGNAARGVASTGQPSAPPSVAHLERGRSVSGPLDSPSVPQPAPASVKHEDRRSPSAVPSTAGQTPTAPHSGNAQTNESSMPPPTGVTPTGVTNGTLPLAVTHGQVQPSSIPSLDAKWRPPGKGEQCSYQCLY